MQTNIVHAEEADVPVVCRLFEEAIAYQKDNQFIGWNTYDRFFIEKDIHQKLLYKITTQESLLGVFSVCYRDELIWRKKEKGDALYLHRIIVNRSPGHKNFFSRVLAWAIAEAKQNNLSYVRMDTWAGNEKLIGYYKSFGFTLVEHYTTADTPDLPQQHRNLHVALLELVVEK
ncbi:GNAT family N-acetyltransferase [Sediminibacterium roseum]|uniref:GNAT family N-acetyltransferase n=1 Tax=Sediminibacterium roseum TaxID=1978412 RepID=A0ABW9ZY37_9BACT|nr:GNAT family N-acetyltransferase [Sediminibacterium roseum]NCI52098.1 GNAT family N-acetyltransferase [Sediminibacterium roseum]